MRKIVAEKLRNGVQERCTTLGLSLALLAQSIDRDATTLRAWLRGVNRITLDDAILLDRFFARHSLPGLLEELRPEPSEGPVWRSEELPLTSVPASLNGIAQGLRAAAAAVTNFLNQHNLLEQTTLFLRVDDAVLPVHAGNKLPVRFGADAFGRDVRHLSDPAFGALIYRQTRELLQRDRAMVHRISSAQGSYRRLAVPVNNRFMVALPYDIELKAQLSFD